MILFHSGGYWRFKHFYQEYVCKQDHLFPKRVSYNRFLELEKEVLFPLTIFIKTVLLGTCTGISFVDSTPLRVCRNQRIHIHKTFNIIISPKLWRRESWSTKPMKLASSILCVVTCPVIWWRIFWKKTQLKADYFFAVLTYGNNWGASPEVWDEFASGCGYKFHYIIIILMVDNWLHVFDINEQMKIDKQIFGLFDDVPLDIFLCWYT